LRALVLLCVDCSAGLAEGEYTGAGTCSFQRHFSTACSGSLDEDRRKQGNQFVKMQRIRFISALLCAALLIAAGTKEAFAMVYWGSRGTQVRKIQQKLKQWGYYDGAVDGVFGQDTYEAVVYFQKKNGLTADGVAGDATLAALGIADGQASAAASAASSANAYASDVELLARLIHGEARGEPYVGMVAVGAVVLNRVKSSRFPNTIAGVIYQTGAFDAVADGQINLTPNEQSRRAARDALNGWDPTSGCLYYYNPSTATSKWIWTREVRLSIGDHSFAV